MPGTKVSRRSFKFFFCLWRQQINAEPAVRQSRMSRCFQAPWPQESSGTTPRATASSETPSRWPRGCAAPVQVRTGIQGCQVAVVWSRGVQLSKFWTDFRSSEVTHNVLCPHNGQVSMCECAVTTRDRTTTTNVSTKARVRLVVPLTRTSFKISHETTPSALQLTEFS